MNVATQIRSLIGKIPTNGLGLPEGIYRPDLLPVYPSEPTNLGTNALSESDTYDLFEAQAPNESTAFSKTALNPNLPEGIHGSSPLPNRELVPSYSTAMQQYEKDLKVAYLRIDYAEGYPTLDGLPIWQHLSFEPADAFVCFEAYLKQAKTGARQMFRVLDDEMIRAYPVQPSLSLIEEYYHTYYWAARARAYDLFYAAARRKEREMRAFETEDEHYRQASKILAVCDAYMDANAEELIETMTPKAFIDLFKSAVQVQRISTGLQANGGEAKENQTPQGSSLEVIMRTMTQQSRALIPEQNDDIIDENGQKVGNSSGSLSKILQDPDLLGMAQELIIRMNPSQPQGGF